jgi:hypothetical protein
MKNNLYYFLITCLSLFSCDKEDVSPEDFVSNRDITVTIKYDGHIHSYQNHNHDVRVYLSNSSETLIIRESSVNLTKLKGGEVQVTFKNISPGNYYIDANWDFNDDGANADEPKSKSVMVTLDGKVDIELSINLLDSNNINDKGWVEGNIKYNGNEEEYHHIYVTIYGPNYYRSKKKITLAPVNLANIKQHGFISNRVERGTYIAIDAFWDKNDNGQYDKGIDPYYEDFSTYFINAGMGLKKNMNLQYE